MDASERKEILNELLSNPVLNGVSIEYKIKRPFEILSQITQIKSGGPKGNRTPNWALGKPRYILFNYGTSGNLLSYENSFWPLNSSLFDSFGKNAVGRTIVLWKR